MNSHWIATTVSCPLYGMYTGDPLNPGSVLISYSS